MLDRLFIKCAFVFANLENQFGPDGEDILGDEVFFEASIEVNTTNFNVRIIKVEKVERSDPDFLFPIEL